MNKSEIRFIVEMDKDRIPEKITWDADEKSGEEISETKAIALALWDEAQKNTLRIDLWTKDMEVNDMKRFYIDCIGGMAQSVLNATGDEFMAQELNAVCDKLVAYLQKEGGQ
jgi:gliding motility-associated protein GldC